MNIKTQKILEAFSDKEIRYMLQYAQSHLRSMGVKSDDRTLQGSILERLTEAGVN